MGIHSHNANIFNITNSLSLILLSLYLQAADSDSEDDAPLAARKRKAHVPKNVVKKERKQDSSDEENKPKVLDLITMTSKLGYRRNFIFGILAHTVSYRYSSKSLRTVVLDE